MRSDFLVFGSPDIQDEDVAEMVDCAHRRWLGTGPKVARFERQFQAYKGSGHAVAVNSCTAALHLSMLTAGLEPGAEVITTALTFCATANAIIHAGCTPVLADVDPLTMNLDPESVAARITDRTRALVVVHFAGRPCPMDQLLPLVERHNLVLIEDCAHAIESTYHGQATGTFGDFGCFSFYVTKNLTTGEGGMVLARDGEAADRIKVLALHGMTQDAWHRFGDQGYKHYEVVECGFKYNMMDLQAALGLHQLERIDRNWQRREAVWNRYQEAFAGLSVRCPSPPEAGTRHAYHLYTLLVDEPAAGISRDRFLGAMTQQKIGVGVHYRSLAEHSFYQQRYGWRPEACPNAWRIGQQTVSLPLSPSLSEADVDDVIEAVTSVLGR